MPASTRPRSAPPPSTASNALPVSPGIIELATTMVTDPIRNPATIHGLRNWWLRIQRAGLRRS